MIRLTITHDPSDKQRGMNSHEKNAALEYLNKCFSIAEKYTTCACLIMQANPSIKEPYVGTEIFLTVRHDSRLM